MKVLKSIRGVISLLLCTCLMVSQVNVIAFAGSNDIDIYFADQGETIEVDPDEKLQIKWSSVSGASAYDVVFTNDKTGHEESDYVFDNSAKFYVNDLGGDAQYNLAVYAYDYDNNVIASNGVDFFLNVIMEDGYPENGDYIKLDDEKFKIEFSGYDGSEDEYYLKLVNEDTGKTVFSDTTKKKYYYVNSSEFDSSKTEYKLWIEAREGNKMVARKLVYFDLKREPNEDADKQEEAPKVTYAKVTPTRGDAGSIFHFKVKTSKNATGLVVVSEEGNEYTDDYEYEISGNYKVWTIPAKLNAKEGTNKRVLKIYAKGENGVNYESVKNITAYLNIEDDKQEEAPKVTYAKVTPTRGDAGSIFRFKVKTSKNATGLVVVSEEGNEYTDDYEYEISGNYKVWTIPAKLNAKEGTNKRVLKIYAKGENGVNYESMKKITAYLNVEVDKKSEYEIKGNIINHDSGVKVKNVNVTFSYIDYEKSDRTNSSGKFELPGTYKSENLDELLNPIMDVSNWTVNSDDYLIVEILEPVVNGKEVEVIIKTLTPEKPGIFINLDNLESMYEYGDKVKLEWESNAASYEVVLHNDTDDFTNFSQETTRDSFNINITSVEDYDQTYTVTVYALDSHGEKVESVSEEFVVKGKVPELHVKLESINDTYEYGDIVKLKWGSNAKRYEVTLYNDTEDSTVFSQETTRSSFNINITQEEDYDQSYKVTVSVLDSRGEKVDSSSEYFVVKGKWGESSDWSKEYIEDVTNNGVLPERLLNELLTHPKEYVTRAQYSEMLIQLYDKFSEENTPAIKYNQANTKEFSDIGNLDKDAQKAILKASALQIISGVTDSTFEPDTLISRQMAATMLRNTYYAMYGYGIDMSSGVWKTSFRDMSEMDHWAVESIRFANALNLLNGDGYNYNPKSTITNEASIAILSKSNKMFENFNEKVNYKIEAYNSIKRYTDLDLECYYNGIFIGTVNDKYVHWQSSNSTVGRISSDKRLEAVGKGNIKVTAEYSNVSISEWFSVDKKVEQKKEETSQKNEHNDIIQLSKLMSSEEFDYLVKHVELNTMRKFIIDNKGYYLLTELSDKRSANILNSIISNESQEDVYNNAIIISEDFEVVIDVGLIKKIDMMYHIQNNLAFNSKLFSEMNGNLNELEGVINRYLVSNSFLFAGEELSSLLGNLILEYVEGNTTPKGFFDALCEYLKGSTDGGTVKSAGRLIREFAVCKMIKDSLNDIKSEFNYAIEITNSDDKFLYYEHCKYLNNVILWSKIEYDSTWCLMKSEILPNMPYDMYEKLGYGVEVYGKFFKSFSNTIFGAVLDKNIKILDNTKDLEKNAQIVKVFLKAYKPSKTIYNWDIFFSEVLYGYSDEVDKYIDEQENIEKKFSGQDYYTEPNTDLVNILISNGENFKR